MIWIRILGIFDIIWALILFLLFLGSQFGFSGGFLLGILALIMGIGILNKKEKIRRLSLKMSIPLGLLATASLLTLTGPEVASYFRMSITDIFKFSGMYILFPIIINFIILTRPKIKEQFKQP